jgi:hypothetical protein
LADHFLIVPPTGLLEVVHSDHPELFDIEKALQDRHGQGTLVRLSHLGVTASWLTADYGQLNPRARDVFYRVADAHFLFTGPVIFRGIDEKLLGDVVGRLSLRDTAGGS